MKRFLLFGVPVLALFVLLSASSVFAASSASANLTVQASVITNCHIDAGSINFGTYDPTTTHETDPLDGQGTFSIKCTKGDTVTIDLGLGVNASGSTRRMASGGDFLTYELYSDPGRSNVWGTGVNPYTPSGTAPNAGVKTVTVYGRVPGGQVNVSSGTYTDTVVATINF